MDQIVTLTHRNVCKEGFTVVDTADSVFLDLPAQWDAIEHAKKALRKDRIARICCFSPCIEQVLRTVSALNDVGFTEITMYETLLRPQDVNQISPLPHVSEIGDKIKQSEIRREEKRLKQIANSRLKRKRGQESPDDSGSKRPRSVVEEHSDSLPPDDAVFSIIREPSQPPEPSTSRMSATSKITVSKTLNEVRGHSSYLTFACLLPLSATPEAVRATTNSSEASQG